jgi:hypothetical protein
MPPATKIKMRGRISFVAPGLAALCQLGLALRNEVACEGADRKLGATGATFGGSLT